MKGTKKYAYCDLDTVNQYKSNILEVLSNVEPSEKHNIVKEGLIWYKSAKNLCMGIAKITGLKVSTVAGILAVLSPNQAWNVQQKHTLKFIQAIQSGLQYNEVGYGYYANRMKAAKMIKADKVYPYLNGIKVTAFYNNIMGIYSEITIDIWAVRIALKNPNINLKNHIYGGNNSRRDEIKQAYILAAKYSGMAPALLQAVTWHIVRNKYVTL